MNFGFRSISTLLLLSLEFQSLLMSRWESISHHILGAFGNSFIFITLKFCTYIVHIKYAILEGLGPNHCTLNSTSVSDLITHLTPNLLLHLVIMVVHTTQKPSFSFWSHIQVQQFGRHGHFQLESFRVLSHKSNEWKGKRKWWIIINLSKLSPSTGGKYFQMNKTFGIGFLVVFHSCCLTIFWAKPIYA